MFSTRRAVGNSLTRLRAGPLSLRAQTFASRHTPKYTGRKQSKGKHAQKGKSASSSRWLERQQLDPYVVLAEERGYRSRAAFKLISINKKFKLLKSGMKVLDLGCAPGSWSVIVKEKVKTGRIVGIDLLEMESIPGVEFLHGDFEDEKVSIELSNMLAGPADCVLSDMAPNLTGLKDVDASRMLNLHSSILKFLPKHLAPGGSFVSKIFRGQYDKEMIGSTKVLFDVMRIEKPQASRQDSREIYIVGKGFKGM
jgi:23S rRNA (uridine2552-2'-O)-methyltransferase